MILAARKETETFSDLLPYLYYEEQNQTLWLRDGSAVKVLEIIPKNVLSATEDELQSLRSGLSGVVSQLPEGAMVQVLFSRELANGTSDEASKGWVQSHSALKDELGPTPSQEQLFDAKYSALKNQWATHELFQTKIYISIRSTPDKQTIFHG